jgi:hypothetical protein
MLDSLAALVVDESRWLPLSLGLALAGSLVPLYGRHHSGVPLRRRVLAAMTLFFGVTIATMAFGHLLAVTTKLATNTLGGPVPVLYLIGAALAVPSFWLVHHARRVLAADDHGRATLGLNAWLVITLLALGLHNLPLAVPGVLNIAYHLHSGRVAGWAIVGLALVVGVGLFGGSLMFLASGQTFEEFRGIP